MWKNPTVTAGVEYEEYTEKTQPPTVVALRTGIRIVGVE